MNKLLLLQNLLFMNFGGNPYIDYATEHCFAMKTAGSLGRFNRVYNSEPITSSEVIAIKDYFKTVNFTWLVESSDHATIKLLEDHGLNYMGSFPAMIADLPSVKKIDAGDKIGVKEISFEDDSIALWTAIACEVYNYNEQEMVKAIHSLIARAQGMLKLYLGFYENKPVAASMALYHQDIVSVHMVGTLPAYRSKGMGYAISSKPLLDAYNKGYATAILTASQIGLPLAEKLGFKEYALYQIYGNY
jgi:GNAT superfamily N-acetyltransferase